MIENICLNEVLLESAKEIFETMIFMDLTEVTEPDKDIEGETLLGSITFKGSLEGCLTICCSTSCAQSIARNMLGLDTDDELTDEDTCDAIGEVSNMVMGSVKKRVSDSFKDIQVSIPSVISGKELKNNLGDVAKKISTMVNIEDEYVAKLSLLYRENS